jgi:hypothetical protein
MFYQIVTLLENGLFFAGYKVAQGLLGSLCLKNVSFCPGKSVVLVEVWGILWWRVPAVTL